jgi:cytochrome oxidase Cu insertion factor (SCO1/SenC/PrrC family)
MSLAGEGSPVSEENAQPQHDATSPRSAAFAAGAPKMSRRVIGIALVSMLTLGLGGIVLDHFFPGTATTSTSSSTTTTSTLPAFLVPGPASGSSPASSTGQLGGKLDAMMSLTRLTHQRAPSFTLLSEPNTASSLSSFRNKVVVLSFFDASCDDICPIVARELAGADRVLGKDAPRVEFLTVNTDPLAVTANTETRAETSTVLKGVHNWQFLTGPLSTLNRVWSAYGVSITVTRPSEVISHTDVLYFIDPKGYLAMRASPFANESRAGVYSLDAGSIASWAVGIARQARSLLGAVK